MNTRRSRYLRHRFPPDIISQAVWLYHRYCLSFRDVEDLLAERGVIVSYETVRQWCGKFGPDYARRLKRRHGRLGDTWFLDEVFVTINGERQYLWRAVDQDGDLIDILVQPRRDARAARRFFRRLLNSQRQEPVRLVTDKLGSYRVAHRDLMPLVIHDTTRYANNRAEVSHQPTRQRERQMRGFTSSDHAQRFLHVHGIIQNLFRVGRHRNHAIRGQSSPKRLSSDNDSLYRFHQWHANLRILRVTEVKSVPYVPLSHPFVERLIGTLRRECVDRTLFWSAPDLEQKLSAFQDFYNAHRAHAALVRTAASPGTEGCRNAPPLPMGSALPRSLSDADCGVTSDKRRRWPACRRARVRSPS